jgi:hypothetical protein
MGEFPQLVMVTRDSRGLGWSASILRRRCDEGMTLLRCATVAYKESNRVANAAPSTQPQTLQCTVRIVRGPRCQVSAGEEEGGLGKVE